MIKVTMCTETCSHSENIHNFVLQTHSHVRPQAPETTLLPPGPGTATLDYLDKFLQCQHDNLTRFDGQSVA